MLVVPVMFARFACPSTLTSTVMHNNSPHCCSGDGRHLQRIVAVAGMHGWSLNHSVFQKILQTPVTVAWFQDVGAVAQFWGTYAENEYQCLHQNIHNHIVMYRYQSALMDAESLEYMTSTPFMQIVVYFTLSTMMQQHHYITRNMHGGRTCISFNVVQVVM